MKNLRLLFIVILCGFAMNALAQKKFSVYAVGFYNLENLFDTCHDMGKRDFDFLPNGSYRWNARKYKSKLRNMSRALADLGTDVLPNVGCAVIGVSEVENCKALDDLTAEEPLRARNFKYILVEGPDMRGVDCALLYNPALFTPTDTAYHYYINKDVAPEEVEETVKLTDEQKAMADSAKLDTTVVETGLPKNVSHTRGFLTITGKLAGETVTIIVCHWPSRFNGSERREWAGQQVHKIVEDLLAKNPDNKIFVMGDLNDDPTNKSVTEGLRGKAEIKDVKEGDMYNPWYNILAKEGQGTLAYGGSWNLFDQILMTPNVLDFSGKKDYTTLKYWKCQIQRRNYLIQTEGRYKGNPKRTHAGGVWLDGYSDHLPTVIYLVKEQK